MKLVYALLLFAVVILSGCGAGGVSNGPELDRFEITALTDFSNNRKSIAAIPERDTFTVNWTTKGDVNRDHTFDFFIRNESSVEDDDNAFMFRLQCGAEAAVLSNCLSVGKVECTFDSRLDVHCHTLNGKGLLTGKTNIGLRDLNEAFMIGRICYLDETDSFNESCTSMAVAAEFIP